MPATCTTCIFLTLTAAWFGTTGAFTRHLTSVLTDRLFGWQGGGCAAGMVIFPLSISQVYLSFVPACMGQGGTVQVRGSGLQYKQNLG